VAFASAATAVFPQLRIQLLFLGTGFIGILIRHSFVLSPTRVSTLFFVADISID
jgi:hypothetical protein